jgi:hypothetical protein
MSDVSPLSTPKRASAGRSMFGLRPSVVHRQMGSRAAIRFRSTHFDLAGFTKDLCQNVL